MVLQVCYKIGLVVIQWLRLSLDFTQFFLSVQFKDQDHSNVVFSLWIWKSLVSTSTNILSFLNNFNDVVPLNLISTFSITNAWANKYSFEQVTLFLQGVAQTFGGIGALIYLPNLSSTQSIGIFVLYNNTRRIGFKKNWERLIFVASAGLNLFQMIETSNS